MAMFIHAGQGAGRHRERQVAGARRFAAVVAIGLLTWSAPAAAGGGIYIAADEGDVIHLSDRAVGLHPILLVGLAGPLGDGSAPPTRPATARARSGRGAGTPQATPDIDAAIQVASRQHGVAVGLIHAVIATESGYGVRAVSPRGAMGLMQLMPVTAREYGVTDPFDLRQNVDAGVRHLRRLLDRFGDDTQLALAAYNAGAGAVERHGLRIPPFTETMAYVPRVLLHLNAMPANAPIGLTSPSP